MDPKGSSPFSQQCVSGSYYEPTESNPHTNILYFKIYFITNITIPPMNESPKWSLPFRLCD